MLCGALPDGGFFRVGKASEAAALALPQVTADDDDAQRPMPGIVRVPPEAVPDPGCGAGCWRWRDGFVEALPPK